MVALLDAMEAGRIPARCALVLSNVAGAHGLEAAASRGVPTAVVDHRESASREEHDAKVERLLGVNGVEVVCLAGYMRLLSPSFVQAFRGRILNIHPALLPAFPGLHVQRKALDHGARFSGCTVHIVDEEVDHGPILLQAVVPILPGDSEESLCARILRTEHRTYAAALRLYCEGRFRMEGNRAALVMDPLEYRELLKELVDFGDAG
jgi:phosphoribosylglycinamide formyltransferase-1